MSKLERLYQRLDLCEQCLAEDTANGDRIGIDFYTNLISSIRGEIDQVENYPYEPHAFNGEVLWSAEVWYNYSFWHPWIFHKELPGAYRP